MIEASGLRRSFGATPAVVDASFRVGPGEVVGLLGPNGAGKTTVLRMLLGLVAPDAGTAAAGPRVGYLPERFAGYDALTVRGYLRYLAATKAASSADVERVITLMDLGDLASRILGRLSRGQYQRVGWAQALLYEPPAAYLLDEPTQGLDPAQVVDARRTLRALADGGAAVLFSTHLLAEAAAVCDRVVVMAAGRVVADEEAGDAATLEERFLRLVAEAELT